MSSPSGALDTTTNAQQTEAVRHLALADELLQRGQFQRARFLYESVLELDPDASSARFGLAESHFGLAQYEDVISIAETAIAEPVLAPSWHDLLGRCHLASENFDEAVRHFDLAIAGGGPPSAIGDRAMAVAKAGHVDAALDALLTSLRETPNKHELIDAVVELSTNRPIRWDEIENLIEQAESNAVRGLYAGLLFRSGLLDEGARLIGRILEIPGPTREGGEPLARSAYVRGALAYAGADRESAVERTQEQIDELEDGYAANEWGIALTDLGLPKEARRNFEAASERGNWFADFNQAVSYATAEEWTKAWPPLKASILRGMEVKDPQTTERWDLARSVVEQEGLATLLRDSASELQEAVDENGELANRFAWAGVLAAGGAESEAFRNALEAVAMDKNHELPIEDVSRLLTSFTSRTQRRRIEVLLSNRKGAEAQIRWASILVEFGESERATTCLDTVRSSLSDSPELIQVAARLYERVKQWEQAAECWQTTLVGADDPDSILRGWHLTVQRVDEEEGVRALVRRALKGAGRRRPERLDRGAVEAARTADRRRTTELADALEKSDSMSDLVRSDVAFSFADKAQTRGLAEIALRLYEHSIRVDPSNFDALIGLADAQRQAGAYTDSSETVARAKRVDPSNPVPDVVEALARSDLNDYETAVAAYDQAIAKALSSGTNMGYRATLQRNKAARLVDMRQIETALRVLEDAHQIVPNAGWTLFSQAQAESARHSYEESDAYYRRAIEAAGTTDHELAAYSHHNIAVHYEETGRYEAARTEWERAGARYRDGVEAAISAGSAYYFLYYGWATLTADNDFDFAELLYRVAEAFDPGEFDVQASLVKLHLDAAAERASEHPGSSHPYHSLEAARSYRLGKRCFASRRNAEAGRKVALARVHLRMDDSKAAEDLLESALKDDRPGSGSFATMGEIQTHNGKHDEAIRWLKIATNEEPLAISARTKLADAYRLNGESAHAEREYRRVLRISPNETSAWLGLGELRLDDADERDDGTYDVCIDYLTRVISAQSSPAFPRSKPKTIASAYYLRGYARYQQYRESRLGRQTATVGKAISDLEKCLALDPEHYRAKRAIERVRDQSLSLVSPRSWMERLGPVVTVAFASVAIVLTIAASIFGRPVPVQVASITDRSVEMLTERGAAPVLVEAATELVGATNADPNTVVDRFESLLGEDFAPEMESLLLTSVEWSGAGWRNESVDLLTLATILFGSLLFLIAGLYLPQLSTLKLGAMHLEKNPVDRRETSEQIAFNRGSDRAGV